MKTLTGICLGLAIATGCVGFFPCAGWLNWFAVPMAAVSALLGVVGLFSDRDKETQGTYFAALVIGTVMGGLFAFRCFLGGGLI